MIDTDKAQRWINLANEIVELNELVTKKLEILLNELNEFNKEVNLGGNRK